MTCEMCGDRGQPRASRMVGVRRRRKDWRKAWPSPVPLRGRNCGTVAFNGGKWA